jgi:threonine/homoserine/homoserine lactone efflux protein
MMTVLGTENLGVFVAAGLLLNITPGADMLFIANRSASQGKKAGIVAALGIGAGCLIHILFAAFGLSVVLATSALAFSLVKYAGAAYLVYLGLATLLTIRNSEPKYSEEIIPLPMARIFRQAILVNALNPKVALFFMALLPQFVSPVSPYPSLSFLFLGVLFDVNGTIINIVFALLTSHIASRFRQTTIFARTCKAIAACLFVGLGIRLAMTTQK